MKTAYTDIGKIGGHEYFKFKHEILAWNVGNQIVRKYKLKWNNYAIGIKYDYKKCRAKWTSCYSETNERCIGIGPSVDVTLEIQEDEIVMSKPKIEGNYTEYYVSTRTPKLKGLINIKEIMAEEADGRHALP